MLFRRALQPWLWQGQAAKLAAVTMTDGQCGTVVLPDLLRPADGMTAVERGDGRLSLRPKAAPRKQFGATSPIERRHDDDRSGRRESAPGVGLHRHAKAHGWARDAGSGHTEEGHVLGLFRVYLCLNER